MSVTIGILQCAGCVQYTARQLVCVFNKITVMKNSSIHAMIIKTMERFVDHGEIIMERIKSL